MPITEPRDDFQRYLRIAREALVFKLDGLSEYGIRRPMTPTGTNLLGLVKHAAGVEIGYFGGSFGRPFGESLPWLDEQAPDNSDMWATADESREDIIGLYRRVWVHSDQTITSNPLDAVGRVPWWGEHGDVTLHLLLLHVIAETNRHAGHADIVRELADGAAGLRADNSNLPSGDELWWQRYREQLEAVALQVGDVHP
ncbi:hypothetical protein ABIB25_004734 [Nakamurella sp. UYEF19]|uniref:DinB family protein n=1 Tax=Nakamurella sp. UYEF19 TaxID=1756392 RepID=UPI0033915CAB